MLKYSANRFFSLIIAGAMMLSLTSCSGSTAQAPPSSSQPANSSEENAFVAQVGANSLFAEGFSTSLDWKNSDGYSGTFTVKTWGGIQGNGEALTHPGNPTISIPAAKNTVCIIPFQLNYVNTTDSADFASKISFSLSGIQPTGADRQAVMDSYNPQKPTEGVFYYSAGGWNHPDYWGYSSTVSGSWQDTKKGFDGRVLGYIAVGSYYSPAYPNGDADSIADRMGLTVSGTANIILKMRASENGIELYENIPESTVSSAPSATSSALPTAPATSQPSTSSAPTTTAPKPTEAPTSTSAAPPATSKPAEETPKPSEPPKTAPATTTPAPSGHQFDMNDPNVRKHPIYAMAKTIVELRVGAPRWRSAAETIAIQKNTDPDYMIDGKTFYDWRMKPIQEWVDNYVTANGLSYKNKTDHQKTAIIKHVIDNGRFEEFIGLWRPGFRHSDTDCVPRAEGIQFMMVALNFEFFDITSGLSGKSPHAWNGYWDSSVGVVRFLDANPSAGVWNLYIDELDEQGHTLD